jgi:hypothetical protein
MITESMRVYSAMAAWGLWLCLFLFCFLWEHSIRKGIQHRFALATGALSGVLSFLVAALLMAHPNGEYASEWHISVFYLSLLIHPDRSPGFPSLLDVVFSVSYVGFNTVVGSLSGAMIISARSHPWRSIRGVFCLPLLLVKTIVEVEVAAALMQGKLP